MALTLACSVECGLHGVTARQWRRRCFLATALPSSLLAYADGTRTGWLACSRDDVPNVLLRSRSLLLTISCLLFLARAVQNSEWLRDASSCHECCLLCLKHVEKYCDVWAKWRLYFTEKKPRFSLVTFAFHVALFTDFLLFREGP